MLQKASKSNFQAILRVATALVFVFALMLVASPAHAQKYKVLHNFTNGGDGGDPDAGLTIDRAGNFYGTASGGGSAGWGTVYKMSYQGSGWVVLPLYGFKGGNDGANPLSAVTIGPDGSIYGQTIGEYDGQGTVFNLKPPATRSPTVLSPWTETVLHQFTGYNDGDQPVYGPLIFDPAGNLYGTTQFGGTGSFGIVYELTPYGDNWIESILYNFSLPTNGPLSGVVRDSVGNLYGTTADGGAVFKLSPSGSGWTMTILHTFNGGNDGSLAYGGLVMDPAGNLYGASSDGGSGFGGVVYELSPNNGGWKYNVIYSLSGSRGPFGNLTLDAAGNLYGASLSDGANDAGMIFKLTPSNGSWTLTDLHDFSFDTAYFPYGAVTLDANGNLFGTASGGGVYGHGVIWEITP